MQQDRYDVLVIGTGVIGCSIAYHLAKFGLRLAVIEREEIASEASMAPFDLDLSAFDPDRFGGWDGSGS